jgi:ABC-type transport system substrate-binding protein
MATPAFMDYWNYYAPESLFDLFYKAGAPYGETRFTDPELDTLVRAVQAEVDKTKRIKLVHEALQRARDTFAFVIPVIADASFAQSAKVHGVVWNYADGLNFRKAWSG